MNKHPSPFAILIACLEEDGLLSDSRAFDVLLRQVAWTTGSEFMGEFGKKMKQLKASQWSHMSGKTRSAFRAAADDIKTVWPGISL